MKEEYLNERMETMPPGELRALQEQKFLKEVEYTPKVTNLEGLKKELEGALHDKLLFGPNVELVPEGTLPRYEMKAKLIRKLYEEQ